MCVAFFALMLVWAAVVPVSAVQDAELELDGQQGESAVWDSSHYIALYDTGILSPQNGITYAELNYLIDENRKTLYLYLRLIDDVPPASGAGSVYLELADGNTILLREDGRAASIPSAQIGYCALILRDASTVVEAQIDFHTVTEAKNALEGISVSFSDRMGRRTNSYRFTPVFPVPPGETESSSAVPETTERDGSEPTTRKESTTKKPSTSKSKGSGTSKSSGKSSGKSQGDKDDDEQEEEYAEIDHSVAYSIESRESSDYRVMIWTVGGLILLLIIAGIAAAVTSFVRKRRAALSERSHQAHEEKDESPDREEQDKPEA